MSGLSDYAELAVINALLRNTALQVATTYVALHSSDPTDAASSTELTDTGYARKSASWDAPSSGAGTTQNSADIDFNAIVDAGPFTITHVSIWDAVSGGNMLLSQSLAVSKSFSQNDVPRFPQGSLVVTAS
jgi:hypothetical protein